MPIPDPQAILSAVEDARCTLLHALDKDCYEYGDDERADVDDAFDAVAQEIRKQFNLPSLSRYRVTITGVHGATYSYEFTVPADKKHSQIVNDAYGAHGRAFARNRMINAAGPHYTINQIEED